MLVKTSKLIKNTIHKKALTIGIMMISSLLFHPMHAQMCQVSINSPLPTDTTDCGDCFTLEAVGLTEQVLLDEDFNNSSLGVGWTSTGNVTYSNPCGPSLDGTPAAWFGNNPPPRELVTANYDLSCGGQICFDLDFGDDDNNSGNCEDPDQNDEGVFFQYSINNGATWVTIFYFDPTVSNNYFSWANYCYNLPAAAQTTSTKLRWYQNDPTSNDYDHWGIDNVKVSAQSCGQNYYYDWAVDGSVNNPDTNLCLTGNDQTYDVIFTDGLTDTCSASITIYSDLKANLDEDTLICGLTQIDLVPNPTGGSGNYNYVWNTGGVTDQLNNVGTTGIYWVEVTDVNFPGCSHRDSSLIEIYPNPDVDFDVFPLCYGLPSQFEDRTSLPSGTDVTSWNWNFDDGGATSSLQNPTHSFSGVGTYNVSLNVETEDGCVGDTTIEIIVEPQPVAAFDANDVCLGETTVFTDQSSGNYATVKWDFDDGSPLNTENNPTHEYTIDDNYNVELIITAANGVCGDTVTKNIYVYDNPNVHFNVDDSVSCSPLCMTLSSTSFVNDPSEIQTYNWYLNNELVQSGPEKSYTECLRNTSNDTQTYDVELVTISNHGCESNLTHEDLLTVYHNPIAEFEYTPEYADVYFPEIEFTNKSKKYDSIFWKFGDFETSSEDFVEVEFPPIAGDYMVELLATTDEGCRDSVFVFINMDDKLLYFVPNTFTPDGNEFNETFRPEFPEVFDPQDFKMFIFNRWGEVVFETRDHEIGWDGSYGVGTSIKADAGTYIWKIEFKEERTDKRYLKTGHVTLIR